MRARDGKILLCIWILVLIIFPAKSLAAGGDFVRTANYYLLSGSALESPGAVAALAEFDLIVIPSEAQAYNRAFFSSARALNPDIVILAYVPTVSWNFAYWDDPLHADMRKGLKDAWWLRDADGNKTSIWPNTRALDINSEWTDYLAAFVDDEMMSTGLWDGIFYDEVMDRNDWKDGYARLFSATRSRLGDDAIVIVNGSSSPAFAPYVNGRMFETFPSTGDGASAWYGASADYLSLSSRLGYDPVIVVNVNTENAGTRNDFQKMRFGLATALLGDGYFSYDFGTESHAQLWDYDEYGVTFGAPKGKAEKTAEGVWKREYELGKAIANPGPASQTVRLGGEFEKIRGSQAPDVNDGSIVTRVTLDAQDGLLLLRPLEDIYKATYLNGAFARIFAADGAAKRNGFFAYSPLGRGGTRVHVADLDGDGPEETVVADDTYLSVHERDGSLRARVAPYGESYALGVNVAIGDLENDGRAEIVTGTRRGGGPQVRVFNGNGTLIHPGFFAYGEAFRGGVNVAVGDVDGDGRAEIVAGAGPGGGPHVRVFSKDGRALSPGFFAYGEAFRGGVNVAVGDVDGDGRAEIVAGAGPGGGPHVRVFSKDGGLRAQFFAFDKDERDGVEVGAADLDRDGRAEIISLSNEVFTMTFR